MRAPGDDARISRRELALVGALLLAALAIRLWRWDLAQIGYDESSAASLVAAWQLDGLLPLTGIVSSVGIPNPPAWPYLMALVLAPFGTPQALVFEGIANSVLATGLTWWVGRRWLGRWGGLAAGVFYATAFWSALLGRSPWQPAFLQIPALLCLDALLTLAVRQRPWALALAAGWLAIMVQLHYVAIAYVVLLPAAAWLARDRLRPRHLVGALLVGLVPLLPFLLYELQPAVRLRDLLALASPPTSSGGSGQVDLEAWSLIWTLAGSGGAAGLGGDNVETVRQALGRWATLGLLGDALLAGGLLVSILRGGARGRLIAAWVLLPAVVLARHTFGVLFHYLYVDLPGMALAVGALAAWAAQHGRIPRLLLSGGLALFAVASVVTLGVVLGAVEQLDVHTGYGVPLRFSLAAADQARAALGPGGQVLIVGGTSRFETEVLRFSLGFSVPASTSPDCSLPPAQPGDVYLLLHAQGPSARALQQAGAPLLATIPRPGDAYALYGPPQHPPAAAAAAARDRPTPPQPPAP